jgi:hypothetical protein
MVLVLGAGIEHATPTPGTVHSHSETVFALDVGHAFALGAGNERFTEEPTLHCGAPVLGLSPFLVSVPKPCTPSYLPSAFVSLSGDVPDPDPKPPKFPLTT